MMRIGTAHTEGAELRAILVVEETAVDLQAAAVVAGVFTEAPRGISLTRWFVGLAPEVARSVEEHAVRLAEVGQPPVAVALSDLRLGPPIPDPEKILCLGLNYAEHVAESGMDRPEWPEIFAKFANALVGAGDEVVLPGISEEIDYEGELAVVIGRRAKDVSAADALDHVAGYMILNDISTRDVQLRGKQWLPGKIQDTSAPCGPLLVPAGDVVDPQSLALRTILNGEVMQDANTSQMVFSVAESISYLSTLLTLEPGDIISTGTPSGVGFARKPPVFLRDGDVIEVEVESLGRLSNAVVTARVAA